MNALVVLIIILLFFIVDIVVVALRSIQRLPKEITDADYYDKNGNHIYSDRKLIVWLERSADRYNK